MRDVLAHITSNFKEMVDPSPTPSDPPPAMTAEQAMDALVDPRRSFTPEQLLAEYEQFREAAFATLTAMQDEPLASAPLPVGELGTYQMHQLANAYCFDRYCHLRHDLLTPSGPLELDLPAADDVRLRRASTGCGPGSHKCAPALCRLWLGPSPSSSPEPVAECGRCILRALTGS